MSANRTERFPVAAVGMAVCLAAGVALAVYVAAAFPGWDSVRTSLAHLAVAVVAVVALRVIVKVRGFARTMGGRQMVAHTEPGHGPKDAADHEGGHCALVKAAGGRVLDAWINPDGSGFTRYKLPSGVSITDLIAIKVAGEVAAGTSRGCESDQASMRAVLATLPPEERDAARRAGYDRARAVTGGFLFDGGVAVTSERLLRHGRL